MKNIGTDRNSRSNGACFLLAAAIAAGASGLWAGNNPYSLPTILKQSGTVRSGRIALPALKTSSAYSILFSIRSPRVFESGSRITVDLTQGKTELLHKTLHLGDPDLYAIFHVPRDGPAELRIGVPAKLDSPANYVLQINRWPQSRSLEQEPNNRWEDANPIALGDTVFGTADDIPYIPLPGASPAQILEGDTGVDWFRIDFDAPSPKLVFFELDLAERDNIPVDVSVYRVVNGRLTPYTEGEDPVSLPHEVQALPGNKFLPRILRDKGAYYVRVKANHPDYKLRTRIYDPPPYRDPHTAVQTAVDYIMGAGDSWHANTPRRGGVWDRVSNVHQETSLCVACHPTHFSQRAQLYAVANGYEVHQRQQLQFLTERFYNNPRPFYGFEQQGAVWARMISASANVLSRMSVLLDLFENQVSGERRDWYHRGVAEYLKLYYRDRTELPPDETNGNTPLVSTYEVAWYSWRVTHDPQIARLIEQDHIKNMIDLCYQTLALADIDRVKYRDQIARNAERILSLQRPDGQWAMRFDPQQPEVEFQTGHALWALEAAGIPAGHPQVAKAIDYLLRRQQVFGGWMDPRQSYENFRTPFRETQMSVLALSSYFPATEPRAKGWHATIHDLATRPERTVQQLDQLWDAPPAPVLGRVRQAASANDALIRQLAIEALGRVRPWDSEPALAKGLGDESKLVQRTAAWAARQVYSRRPATATSWLTQLLNSPDDRTRWGATRVFATHFSALARHGEFAEALAARVRDDVPTIRMQALKGLWQFWFWTADERSRDLIENTFLAAMDAPQHPWVEQNLREGVYNLADENVRYLYNNWVPLLATAQDRERAIRGRLATEARLAEKFSRVLETGSDRQRHVLLTGLTQYPLRRPDIYDLKADHNRPLPPVYNRIGNDIEQIAFYGTSAGRLAHALRPLVDSPDPQIRRLATQAVLLCRPMNSPGVNALAGEPDAARSEILRLVATRTDPDSTEVAKALQPPKPRPATYTAGASNGSTRFPKPDEAVFRAEVQPILEKRGKDGYACVHCHITHTLFNGSYATALNVIDLNDPENSLILRKPTSSSESEGVLGAKTLAHGGGVRWEKNSPEYLTILNWIRGSLK